MEYSQYDPIWNALKASKDFPKQISITANRLLHPRIIKAVTKRKWLDIAYKLQIDPKTAILTHVRDGSKLTFILTYHLNHSPLTVKDI
jgi:hypothetical protein